MASSIYVITIIGSILAVEAPPATAVEMLNKALGEAHSLGGGFETRRYKPDILGEIALGYADVGEKDHAASTWKQAIEAIPRHFEYIYIRVLAEKAIGHRRYDMAIQALDVIKDLSPLPIEVEEDANSIEKGFRVGLFEYRRESLKGIAALRDAEKNDVAGALESVNQFDSQKSGFWKVKYVQLLVVQRLDRGDSAGVLRFVTSLKDLDERDSALRKVTLICANRGNLELAQRIAEQIGESEYERVLSFAALGRAFQAANRRDRAAEWFGRAETIATSIQYLNERARAFDALAVKLAEAGHIDKSIGYANQIRELFAVDVFRDVESGHKFDLKLENAHEFTLKAMFGVCIKQENIDGARRIFRRIRDKHLLSECRYTLIHVDAVKAIREGDIQAGLKIVEEQGSSIQKYGPILPRLAAVLTEAGEYKLALKLTEQMKAPWARCYSYRKIAEGLSKGCDPLRTVKI